MNLHEYQSKQLFANYGIPVPTGYVAANAEEAAAAARRIGDARRPVRAERPGLAEGSSLLQNARQCA